MSQTNGVAVRNINNFWSELMLLSEIIMSHEWDHLNQRSSVSRLVTHRFSDVSAKFPEIQLPPFRLLLLVCCLDA